MLWDEWGNTKMPKRPMMECVILPTQLCTYKKNPDIYLHEENLVIHQTHNECGCSSLCIG